MVSCELISYVGREPGGGSGGQGGSRVMSFTAPSSPQAADEPAYLTVGTDVSAKYRGAFCEAKIKAVKRLVKVKVIDAPAL